MKMSDLFLFNFYLSFCMECYYLGFCSGYSEIKFLTLVRGMEIFLHSFMARPVLGSAQVPTKPVPMAFPRG